MSRPAPATCGRAAHRVGVLHVGAVRAGVRGDDRRAGEQRAHVRRGHRLPRLRAQRLQVGGEHPRRCRASPRRSSPRPGRRCAAAGRGRVQASTSLPSMPSVPLISARPSFSASTTGAIPARGSASAAGRSAPVGVAHLALADQRQRDVCQRRQVAGAAERAVLGHDRGDAGVEQGGQRRGGLGPDAGAAGGQRRQPQQHQRPHHLALDLRPAAGGVRADQRALQRGPPLRPGCAWWPARRSRSRCRSAARRRRPAPRRPLATAAIAAERLRR